MTRAQGRPTDHRVAIVVDASGSTYDARYGIARLVAQLADEMHPLRCEIYSWDGEVSQVDPRELERIPDDVRCSWAALGDFLKTAQGDVVVVTDACMSHESEVPAVRRAADVVRERETRSLATHVVLVGDSPDERTGVRLQSGDHPAFSADQVLTVAGAIRGLS